MTEDMALSLPDIAMLTTALESAADQPTRCDILIQRAHVHNVVGDRVESVSDYLSAFEIAESDQKLCHIACMVSLALLEAGEREQSLWWAVRAVELHPGSAESHRTLGLSSFDSEFYDLAVASFEKAIKFDPACSISWIGLSRAHREDGRFDQCLSVLTRYIAEHPDDPAGYYEAGWTVHLNPRHFDRVSLAKSYYGKALDHQPDMQLKRKILLKLTSLDENAI